MNKIKLSTAAADLGLTRQRLDQFARENRIGVKTDPLSGVRYVTRAELDRFKTVARPAGRKPK